MRSSGKHNISAAMVDSHKPLALAIAAFKLIYQLVRESGIDTESACSSMWLDTLLSFPSVSCNLSVCILPAHSPGWLPSLLHVYSIEHYNGPT